MAEKPAGHILIECPNTIFHLYARDEGELSKIDFSLWFNMKSYYLYFLQKFRYQFAQYAG